MTLLVWGHMRTTWSQPDLLREPPDLPALEQQVDQASEPVRRSCHWWLPCFGSCPSWWTWLRSEAFACKGSFCQGKERLPECCPCEGSSTSFSCGLWPKAVYQLVLLRRRDCHWAGFVLRLRSFLARQMPCTVASVGALICFRKCNMAIFQEIFKVIPAEELDTAHPHLRTLSRRAAEEWVLSGILLPVTVSDLLVGLHPWLYASDASLSMGAVCEAPLEEKAAQVLWQSGDFKGARTCLEPWQHHTLKACFDWEAEDLKEALGGGDMLDGAELHESFGGVSKPLAMRYDFLEVCGGSGVVSEQMNLLGFVVGPIIDLSFSRQYDLTQPRLFEWLVFMIREGRLRSLMLEPPCTTFSPAAHPNCRSYKVGYQKSLWETNLLSSAWDFCGWHAKLKFLGCWRQLENRRWHGFKNGGGSLYGLVFPSRVRPLVHSDLLFRRSSVSWLPHGSWEEFVAHALVTRDHTHVRIQGALTKGSAVYCPALARAIAELFALHLNAERS